MRFWAYVMWRVNPDPKGLEGGFRPGRLLRIGNVNPSVWDDIKKTEEFGRDLDCLTLSNELQIISVEEIIRGLKSNGVDEQIALIFINGF